MIEKLEMKKSDERYLMRSGKRIVSKPLWELTLNGSVVLKHKFAKVIYIFLTLKRFQESRKYKLNMAKVLEQASKDIVG